MGPFEYIVKEISGDYALLLRTDNSANETILVALALLPSDIDINTKLLWENLIYKII